MRLTRTTMRKMNETKLLQLLSRLWNGSNGVLAGKHAEEKMISILRNRFPQAQLIEVTDVSGTDLLYALLYWKINLLPMCLKGLPHTKFRNSAKDHKA